MPGSLPSALWRGWGYPARVLQPPTATPWSRFRSHACLRSIGSWTAALVAPAASGDLLEQMIEDPNEDYRALLGLLASEAVDDPRPCERPRHGSTGALP